jgi:hypothetical protein
MSDIGNTVMEELRARRNRLALVRQALSQLTKQERREVLAETLEGSTVKWVVAQGGRGETDGAHRHRFAFRSNP